ncbi:MAG: HxsD-like protein [Clostridia bacterium]|nr:HxsD-like protein [Clostridia bacterium]
MYSREDIEKSIHDFSSLAIFDILDKADSYYIKMSEPKFDEKQTAGEFENYLIDLTFRSMKSCL